MRVKIEGLITAERLGRALAQAAALHEDDGEPFDGFYGATLYLHAYSREGEPIGVYQGEQEMSLTVRRPAGTLLRPPLSERAAQARAQRVADARQARDQQRERVQQWHAEHQRRMEADRLRRERLRAELRQHKATFDRVLEAFGTEVVVQCNAALDGIWAQWQPLVTAGPAKGQRREQPVFAVADGRLTLRSGAGRHARPILSPL